MRKIIASLSASAQVMPPEIIASGPSFGLRIHVLTTAAATPTMKKPSIGRLARNPFIA
jgi:hypothetical protein